MMIDCNSCTVRGAACTDCVVTFLTIPVRPASLGETSADGATAPGRSTSARSEPDRSTVGAGVGAGARVDLDDGERVALGVLAASGLVPPLRMERAM